MTVDLNKTRIHDKRGKRSREKLVERHLRDLDSEHAKLTYEMINIPESLDTTQLKAYRSMLDKIIMAGNAYANDAIAVEMLCYEYAIYMGICEVIADDGETVGEGRSVRIHPLSSSRFKLATNIRTMLKEFSMLPSGRKVINAPKKDDDEEWDEYFN